MSASDPSVTPTTKRTRFNLEPELPNNKTGAAAITPSAAAHDVASSGILTLHPSLHTIANAQLLQFMKLYAQQNRQQETIEKLNVDTFIPRSARLAFTLKASTATTDTPEFTSVAAATADFIKIANNTLKQFIVQTASLELVTIRRSLVHHVINSIIILARGSLLTVSDNDEATNHMTLALVKSVVYEKDILDLFIQADILLDTLLATLLPTSDSLTHTQLITVGQAHGINIATQQTVQVQFQQAIRKMFCDSRLQFDMTSKANKLRLRMEQFAKLHMSEKTANATIMELDLEPTLPPALLSKLITDKVHEATKTLRKEIQSLKSSSKSNSSKTKNAIAPNDSTTKSLAKNKSRGATKQTRQKSGPQTTQQSTRAPSTNKKEKVVKQQNVPSSSQKKKIPHQRNQQVEDAANDSTNALKTHGQSSQQKNRRK